MKQFVKNKRSIVFNAPFDNLFYSKYFDISIFFAVIQPIDFTVFPFELTLKFN
jgi:hypothetical protein